MLRQKIIGILDRRVNNMILARKDGRRIPLWMIKSAVAAPLASARHWKSRIDEVLRAPDNVYIPRTRDAGSIRNGFQIMHNGVRVRVGQYYGTPIQLMLSENRGVHEPQEERVFGEVLKHIRPGGVMVELGAYWGFYSLWFQAGVDEARSYLVEPDPVNLQVGRDNFAANNKVGTFIQAFVGAAEKDAGSGRRVLSVDALVNEHKIDHIDILHSDIQGAEHEMLLGARKSLRAGLIDYLFISTHSNKLHSACTDLLDEMDFALLAEANLDDSYSFDGVIAAKAPHVQGPDLIAIALKSKQSARCEGVPARSIFR